MPVSVTVFYTFSFILTNVFDSVTLSIGIGQTFVIFAGFAVFAAIFVYFLVPETKGKSFNEIQLMLSGKK